MTVNVSELFDPDLWAEVPGFDPHWVATKHADLREVTRLVRIFHSSDRSCPVPTSLEV